MKAPKEIYVHELSAQELSEPPLGSYHIKYIRADLAEPLIEEYNNALNIAKAWYRSDMSTPDERRVALAIFGDIVREPINE